MGGTARATRIGYPPLSEQARDLRAEAMSLLAMAKQGVPASDDAADERAIVDFAASGQLIGRATALLELEAKLVGELSSGVTVQVVLAHPLVAELVAFTRRALERHPEALADWDEEMGRLRASRALPPRTL